MNAITRMSKHAAATAMIVILCALAAAAQTNGTPGKIPKFKSGSTFGNSEITEDKDGKIGIGTPLPTSKLTVQGVIESLLGFKFPDGTLQTTAGIANVTHDASLTGSGAPASPLGIADGGVNTTHIADSAVTSSKIAPAAVGSAQIAGGTVVRGLNGLTDQVTLVEGANVEITPVGNTLTVAAPNALTAVTHDETLTGDGTAASPLSAVSPEAFQEPVVRSLNFGIFPGETTNDFSSDIIITVPSGKRLVIEHVSGQCVLPTGQRLRLFALGTTSGFQELVPVYIGDFNILGGRSQVMMSTPLRRIEKSGAEVEVFATRGGDTTGTALCSVAISGYMINEPIPSLK